MIAQAVVLCGGLGTRLGALTADTPKPLLEIAGRPFLDILLDELSRWGLRRMLLLAGFAGEKVRAYAAETPLRARLGLQIDVAVEPEPAGTGGAVWQARDRLEDKFLLLNGDSWFDADLADLANRLEESPQLTATLALRRLADASRYGVVSLDGDRIAGFAERPAAPGPGVVSGGIYALRRRIVDTLTPNCSLERDVLPLLAKARALAGFIYNGYFIDIGIPADFARAQSEVPEIRRRVRFE